MTVLYRRRVKVNIGDIEISNNKIEFEISKTATQEPNSAVITIFNLNPDTRGRIQQIPIDTKIIVEAGHLGLNPITGKVRDNDDNLFIIFYGDLKQAFQFKQGPNWITRLELGDGYEAVRTKRVSLSFEAGTTYSKAASNILNKTFSDTGVFIGDAEERIEGAKQIKTNHGFSVVGPGSQALTEALSPLELEYTIIDNAVFVKKFNKPINAPIPLISKDSGLIGSPEPGKDGTIKFQTIIQKGLLPGHQIELISAISPDGTFYKIERVDMTGGSYDNQDFTATVECKEIS